MEQKLFSSPNILAWVAYQIGEPIEKINFFANIIAQLNKREYKIFVERIALPKDTRKTLSTLAKDFGVTTERVRQIEAKTLEKIRQCIK